MCTIVCTFAMNVKQNKMAKVFENFDDNFIKVLEAKGALTLDNIQDFNKENGWIALVNGLKGLGYETFAIGKANPKRGGNSMAIENATWAGRGSGGIVITKVRITKDDEKAIFLKTNIGSVLFERDDDNPFN